jgi:hypothetical protein
MASLSLKDEKEERPRTKQRPRPKPRCSRDILEHRLRQLLFRPCRVSTLRVVLENGVA